MRITIQAFFKISNSFLEDSTFNSEVCDLHPVFVSRPLDNAFDCSEEPRRRRPEGQIWTGQIRLKAFVRSGFSLI